MCGLAWVELTGDDLILEGLEAALAAVLDEVAVVNFLVAEGAAVLIKVQMRAAPLMAAKCREMGRRPAQ